MRKFYKDNYKLITFINVYSHICLGVEYIIHTNISIAIIVCTFMYTYVTLINKNNQSHNYVLHFSGSASGS